jgi:DNA-binding NarL/FixJ family response regulator
MTSLAAAPRPQDRARDRAWTVSPTGNGPIVGLRPDYTIPSPRATTERRNSTVVASEERLCLSTEELAILALVAHGLPAAAVAARIGVSTRTMRRRLRGVCDRLGVPYPIQAVVWAVRRGLI